jgi:pyocin large subunit-like protein
VVENVTLVAANDYTKNISELVFSPAVYVRPQTTLNGKAIPYKEVKNTTAISERKYKAIEGELKSEREKRSKIADDVRKIREQLDTIQLSVNSGSSCVVKK